MISAISGELRRVEEDRVSVQCGAILYELLVPAADVTELHVNLGEQVTFHTIFYLEGDAARGNLEPKLIGFLRADDRKFFERFTTVKGIGPKKALKLVMEFGAIENMPTEIQNAAGPHVVEIRRIFLSPEITEDVAIDFEKLAHPVA